ncbi:Shedu immune nuclease family protein [Elizabethkingia anophelis]|uniref:Shedu immune nuclease family protein n=1 Tax=Elizabethkingia anophelis TaxID=1117645 RepID=UPI000976D7C4|nr:Shedu immune nuclease family protein [Elizabethkingia anophelis]
MADFKGEKLVKTLATKEVYDYIDTEKGINQISRELFLKKDQIVHYPRGFDGGNKYKTIQKFTYIGFKRHLPVGVFKSANYGWGFTKPLYPFTDFIDDNYDFNEVVIEKGGKVQMDISNKKLYLNETCLDLLQNSFKSIFKKNKAEVDFVLQINLHKIFPSTILQPTKRYVQDALASSLASWGNSIDEFSDDDKNAIKDLFDKLSIGTDFLTSEALAKTKQLVDTKYIQATLKKFKQLMALRTDSESLEKQWQEFLRDNSWIFSSIFAQPVILFQREAYVGGKTINNHNGKFNDFLIKNSLSDNVSFLELKTHKTKLLEKSAYRGDDVFSTTKDLSGCIIQVLNQRDNFQKEFYATKGKSKGKGNFETFNSKCVVLIGSTKDLDENQRYSFELFRSNSRDVEVITFDELQIKIESLQKVMTTK